jgi:hypothetical protein
MEETKFAVAWYCTETNEMNIEILGDCANERECLVKLFSDENTEYHQDGKESILQLVNSDKSDDEVISELMDGGMHVVIKAL